jgi:hypothetical protein
MWRVLLIFIVLSGISLQAGEQVFISGGPALRYFERHKAKDHDKYWGNFIDAVLARHKQVVSSYSPEDTTTWLIFRPGYIARGKEEKIDLLPLIEKKAADIKARVVWFDTKAELITYLNKGQDRGEIKIKRLEYFGHSNKRCFMFDYSNQLDGAVPDYSALHLDDLSQIQAGAFTPDAYCQSWGCHSGEEYSKVWKKYVRVPLVGAIGKTDYSKGGLPILSTANGIWFQ